MFPTIWRAGLILLACVGPGVAAGQSVQLYGVYPAALIKGDLGDRLGFSIGASSEVNAIGRTIDNREFPAEVLNVNTEAAVSFDAHPNINLAAGFLFRINGPFTDGSTELRPWQQVTAISRLGVVRLRNRARLEQRLLPTDETEMRRADLRLRYRLSGDMPLEGERLDAREFYLNVSTEAMFTLTRARVIFFRETRSYVGVGYRFASGQRLEPGLEFRARRINADGDRRHFLFLRLTWITHLSG